MITQFPTHCPLCLEELTNLSIENVWQEYTHNNNCLSVYFNSNTNEFYIAKYLEKSDAIYWYSNFPCSVIINFKLKTFEQDLSFSATLEQIKKLWVFS
jgi:hypothetical protein